jgi:hypothetical protein
MAIFLCDKVLFRSASLPKAILLESVVFPINPPLIPSGNISTPAFEGFMRFICPNENEQPNNVIIEIK